MILTPLVAKLIGTLDLLVGEFQRNISLEDGLELSRILVDKRSESAGSRSMFQLTYKEDTDSELLFKNINKLKDIEEFFIQKAIGWSLREYSRIAPKKVESFIKNNELSSLSTREGLKIIKKNRKK